MVKYIRRHGEPRWGLAVKFDGQWRLLGKYCWSDATSAETVIRTFRTREAARTARKSLASYRKEARVIPVSVVYESR